MVKKWCFLILLFFSQLSLAKTHFLIISDIHYGSQNTPGKRHDTGNKLLQLAMTKLSELSAQVNFIIILGDIPTHGTYPVREKEEYEKHIFQSLAKANTSKKPLFYVTGNNDSLQGNYKPFSKNGHSPLSLAKNWNGACLYCQNLLINDEHMYDSGYYSSYVMPNNHQVVLIALNSIQFIDFTAQGLPPYPYQRHDAQTQLKWLKQQLKQNYAKQLLIAMHVPPGVNYQGKTYWQAKYLEQFVALLDKYASHYQQITLLTSHTHMDEIRKITMKDTANIYAFSTPSVSPIHGNNPAMKVFTLSADYSLENFTTYYTASEASWLNNHYVASKQANSIFSGCKGAHLAACLDDLNKEQICKEIERGDFYSVKSNLVDNSACRKIYSIN